MNLKVFIPVFLLASYCSVVKSQVADGEQYKVDTFIIKEVDTTYKACCHDLKYTRQDSMVAFFEPYFVTDICAPDDYEHPAYKRFMAEAAIMEDSVRERLPAVVARALESLSRYQEEESIRLRKIDAKTCRIVPIPVYSLTPNAVLYAGSAPIHSFFNLDTSHTRYFIYQDFDLVGVFFYYKNDASYGMRTDVDEYARVLLSLFHVTKFLIAPDMKVVGNQLGFPLLAYLYNGHVIINRFFFRYGDVMRGGPNGPVKISEQYHEEHISKLLEVYYSTKGTTLGDKIAAAYKSVLKRKQLK